jgi:hypothetical protein
MHHPNLPLPIHIPKIKHPVRNQHLPIPHSPNTLLLKRLQQRRKNIIYICLLIPRVSLSNCLSSAVVCCPSTTLSTSRIARAIRPYRPRQKHIPRTQPYQLRYKPPAAPGQIRHGVAQRVYTPNSTHHSRALQPLLRKESRTHKRIWPSRTRTQNTGFLNS